MRRLQVLDSGPHVVRQVFCQLPVRSPVLLWKFFGALCAEDWKPACMLTSLATGSRADVGCRQSRLSSCKHTLSYCRTCERRVEGF